jgi:hypothetical protein
VIRFLARVAFTFCVSVATVCLLLLASHTGEVRRCHALDPDSAAYTYYCEAGR